MIQGHKFIVIPAPESMKKILASSESSRKPRMVAMMSPVSRLLSGPLLSARENRKSSERKSYDYNSFCHKFSLLFTDYVSP